MNANRRIIHAQDSHTPRNTGEVLPVGEGTANAKQHEATLSTTHATSDAIILQPDVGLSTSPASPYLWSFETGDTVWRVAGPCVEPPERLVTLAGDALFDYRASLDHLAWEFVKAEGSNPDDYTEFPIFNDPGKFEKSWHRRLPGLSNAGLEAIRQFQPCFAPNPHWATAMSDLYELHIVDKHRHLNLVSTATAGGLFASGGPLEDRETPSATIHNGPIQEGTILARTRSWFPAEYSPVFDAAFVETGRGIQMTLSQISDTIGRNIIPELERVAHGG